MGRITHSKPNYMAQLIDIRNAIDNVVGEAKHYKRLAMSRPEVVICRDCVFAAEAESGDYICEFTKRHEEWDFFCKRGMRKDD